MKSKTVWQEGMKSVVDNGRGHTVVVDLPEAKGGTDVGATALELAVMGLSGCITTIFALQAKKMGVTFSALTVDLNAEKPDKELTVKSVSADVIVKSKEDKGALQKILDRTMKLCPVGVIYERAGIDVKVNLIVE